MRALSTTLLATLVLVACGGNSGSSAPANSTPAGPNTPSLPSAADQSMKSTNQDFSKADGVNQQSTKTEDAAKASAPSNIYKPQDVDGTAAR